MLRHTAYAPACLSFWCCRNRTYQLDLSLEGVNFLPAREDALLLLGEVDRHGGVECCLGVVAVDGGHVFLVFDSPQSSHDSNYR